MMDQTLRAATARVLQELVLLETATRRARLQIERALETVGETTQTEMFPDPAGGLAHAAGRRHAR